MTSSNVVRGSHVPAATLRERRLRRRVSVSTAVVLALMLPRLALSLAVLVLLTHLIFGQSGTTAWVTIAAFVASGPVVLVRSVESVLALLLFRLRRPTDHELRRLDRAWHAVTTRAGVDGHRYALWIEDSKSLNAFAAAGHTVAVTGWAVANLSPRHLEAVLAHELGHHLGGHTWAGMLSYWYSLPGRWFVRLIRRVVYVAVAVVGVAASMFDRTGLVGRFVVPLVLRLVPALLLVAVAYGAYRVHPALLLLFLTPWLVAWFRRLGEHYADAVAAELGYRAEMLGVLHAFVRSGQDVARAQTPWRQRLMTSHPPFAERIRALERR